MTTALSNKSGLSILFPVGGRPRAADILDLCGNGAAAVFPFSVSYVDDAQPGWLELLAAGLAFDLGGLAPGGAEPAPGVDFRYGLDGDSALFGLEAITLRPGPHLSGGERLMPVVRAMCGVAVALSQLPAAAAVVWHPAHTALSCLNFQRLVTAWLNGGAFPALGLTALSHDSDGRLQSHGLSYFTGQELILEPIRQGNPASLVRIAVRLIHRLVEGEGVSTSRDFTGPEGERLKAELSADGRILRVWQKA